MNEEKKKVEKALREAKWRIEASLIYSGPEATVKEDEVYGSWTNEKSAKLGFEFMRDFIQEVMPVEEAVKRHLKRMEEVPVEKPPTEVPEGVELVKFEFLNEKFAEMAETIFDATAAGTHEFRSAVNLGTMVRTVMFVKGAKSGTPIEVEVKDRETAWLLQQLIDWGYRDMVEILATRREGVVLEVAYVMKGIKPPPPKEKLIYRFQKTDGWTLVGEEKKRR